MITSQRIRTLFVWVVVSRILTLMIGIISTFSKAKYDLSTEILCEDAPGSDCSALVGYLNWDGIYFQHIATEGYEYEHMHAFYPLAPICINFLSKAVSQAFPVIWFLPELSSTSVAALAALILSSTCTLCATIALYLLTKEVWNEPNAYRTAVLFLLSPSNIFYTAAYSESLYACLSFGGFFWLLKSEKLKSWPTSAATILASICFGLASAARSNGALLSLFVAWNQLQASPPLQPFNRFLSFWISTFVLGIICILPGVTFLRYGYERYCATDFQLENMVNEIFAFRLHISPDASLNNRDARPWCEWIFPNIYSFVQKHYWNVGFLSYYELKQIPNFMLAMPAIGISLVGIKDIFDHIVKAPDNMGQKPSLNGLRKNKVAPHIIYWAVLTLIALTSIHIQVMTRFLSACPSMYWYVSTVFSDPENRPMTDLYKDARIAKWYLRYAIFYVILGNILFVNFYPWT